MLLLELNEFNLHLLRAAAAHEPLPHVQRLLRLPRSVIFTQDRDETGFLEPWVQWVSIHTGEPSPNHAVKHLGDLPHTRHKFIWETLDQRGITTGIWGVMNGARRESKLCTFFLPDPWTFSEQAYPATLAPLLAMPRYLARNYLNISEAKVARLLLGFVWTSVRSLGLCDFTASLGLLIRGVRQFGMRPLVFITWFEYLSTLAFLRYRAGHRPAFSLLFLNILAHVQHHYWTAGVKGVTPEIRFAIRAVDRLLGRIFAAIGEATPLIVTNALSQKNTKGERTWILYRQKDPRAFVDAIGLGAATVEPLMTYDAHVFFHTAAERSAAVMLLSEAQVSGRRVFEVEADNGNPLKLFYRINFTDELPVDAVLEVNGRRLPFFAWFTMVVKRTGRHIRAGTVFARGIALPAKLENHRLHDIIGRYFYAGDAAAQMGDESPRLASTAT